MSVNINQLLNQSSSNKENAKLTRLMIAILVISTLLVLSAVAGFFLGREVFKEDVKENIDKFVLVPEGEKPTVAVIEDLDVVKEDNPELYADAKEGDKILVFTTKIIIYRESENKIINVYTLQPSE